MESLKEKISAISKQFRDEEEKKVSDITNDFIVSLRDYFKNKFDKDLIEYINKHKDALRFKKCNLNLNLDVRSFVNNKLKPHITLEFLEWHKTIEEKDDFIENHYDEITVSVLHYIYSYLSNEFVCTKHIITSSNIYYVTISW